MNNPIRDFHYKDYSIRYSDTGEGQPIVLLHGFGASSYSWRYLAKFLSSKCRVILIDLKGFGLSDKPMDSDYSVRDQSLIVQQFIREKQLENVVLGGHSFGGAVATITAIELAKQKHNPLSKIILIDSPAYKQDLPFFIDILRTPVLNHLSLNIFPTKFNVRFILKAAFYDDTKISDEMIQIYSSYMNLPGSHHALIKTAEQIVPSDVNKIVEEYRNINIPVLVVWGDKDTVVPLSIGKKLSKDIPNSTLFVITNCGHVPQEECPEETIRIISQFIGDGPGQ